MATDQRSNELLSSMDCHSSCSHVATSISRSGRPSTRVPPQNRIERIGTVTFLRRDVPATFRGSKEHPGCGSLGLNGSCTHRAPRCADRIRPNQVVSDPGQSVTKTVPAISAMPAHPSSHGTISESPPGRTVSGMRSDLMPLLSATPSLTFADHGKKPASSTQD